MEKSATRQTEGQTNTDYTTRRKRRDAVRSIMTSLSAIRDAEQNYLKRVPDNLQGAESFETGEYAVDALDEILDLLSEVY